jgi:hypothetical protein
MPAVATHANFAPNGPVRAPCETLGAHTRSLCPLDGGVQLRIARTSTLG